MGRAKIPRKSTNIDMTAMCDVAFLLLSFFILATKQKPPEAVTVKAPTAVSAEVAAEKAIVTTLTKDGKVFLMLGEDTKRMKILENVNTNKGLGLSPDELKKLGNMPFIGVPFGSIKALLNREGTVPADQMPGIPITDSANNELADWYAAIIPAYDGNISKINEILLLKGDGESKYPAYKNVKFALKKNSLYKFRIITSSESTPIGSELDNNNRKGVDDLGKPLELTK